eukprot:202488_1
MSYNNYHSRNNKKRYSPPHSRNSNTRYSPPQDSPNRQRHYQGYNPFLDNAQENERHKETINEWACLICSVDNHGNENNCRMCGTAKPLAPPVHSPQSAQHVQSPHQPAYSHAQPHQLPHQP